MTIKEFVEKSHTIVIEYGIHKGKITPLDTSRMSGKEWLAFASVHKQEIIDFLNAQKLKRERKINSIPGLQEIRNLKLQWAKWHYKFQKSFDSEDGGGVGVGNPPKIKVEELLEQYPIAKDFLRAENEWLKSNYQLSAIGKHAMEKIIDNPEQHEEVIAEMQKEIDDFVAYHVAIGD